MNKQKGIIIGILALIVTMMVGYAIFSETITINGTATAKGEFDMTITCEKGLPDIFSKTEKYAYGFFGSSVYMYNDNNYKNDECSINGNAMTYNVELTQPGAERTFVAKITNSGTIDSILNMETGLSGEMQRCTGNIETDTLGECTSDYEGNNMNDIEVLAFESSTGELTPYLYNNPDIDKLLTYFNQDTMEITLSPGESMYLRVVALWDPSTSNSGFAPGNKAYYEDRMQINFTFTQPKTQ